MRRLAGMKPNRGAWVEEFRFTDEQRSDLLNAWAESHRDRADGFLDAAEKAIALWRTENGLIGNASAPDLRDRADRIAEHARELGKALAGAEQAFTHSFDAHFVTILNRDKGKPGEYSNQRALSHLKHALAWTGPPPSRGPFLTPLSDVAPFLEWLLGRMADAAKEAGEAIKSVPAIEERRLAVALAGAWRAHYGKQPGIGPTSNFAKFCTGLKPILDMTIGRALLKTLRTQGAI